MCNESDLNKFIHESRKVMSEAKFDLRGWEYTHMTDDDSSTTPVLGLH